MFSSGDGSLSAIPSGSRAVRSQRVGPMPEVRAANANRAEPPLIQPPAKCGRDSPQWCAVNVRVCRNPGAGRAPRARSTANSSGGTACKRALLLQNLTLALFVKPYGLGILSSAISGILM